MGPSLEVSPHSPSLYFQRERYAAAPQQAETMGLAPSLKIQV